MTEQPAKYETGSLAARIERELLHQIACCKLRLADPSLDSLDRLGWRSRMHAYGTSLRILEWESSRPSTTSTSTREDMAHDA